MSDNYLRKIEQLQHELEQAKAREEQERREKEQAKAREEQERREKEQAMAREEQERREKEELRRQVEKTTLEEYLRDCHLYLFKSLQIADESISSTGRSTKVDGKYYPLWLRPWEDFTATQREHFDKIKSVCGNSRLFHQSIATRAMDTRACPDPVSYEKEIEPFEKVAIEAPVRDIFGRLKDDPDIRKEFNFVNLQFSVNHRRLRQQSKIDLSGGDEDPSEEVQQRPRRTRPNKRLATKQNVKTSSAYPDGWGNRIYPKGEYIAFVYDYKAAHKLKVEDLKQALAKEKLFMEAIHRTCSNKFQADTELNEQDAADTRTAMSLTQVFDYMVTHGVAYGYITSGKSLVFLYTDREDLRTLYYYHCIPDEKADGENGAVNVFYTAVAQLTSFCLLALRSEALRGSSLEEVIEKAKLQRWGVPYEESANLLEKKNVDSSQSALSSQATTGSLFESKTQVPPTAREISLRSRSTRKDPAAIRKNDDEDDNNDEEQDDKPSQVPRLPGISGTNKRKEGPSSSSSSEGKNHNTSSDSDSPPAKQYCTQACLLGLKRECHLDENCPNVSWHRTIESGTKHPINAAEFTSLVSEQLGQNPYQDCVALDPLGLLGKIGAIGALFKLELAQYGYTFVGKGTQPAHLRHLHHESLIYSRLERLQGEVVPVHLGIIDMIRGYLLPGGARVFHMMLMSWGGEVAAGAGVLDMKAELKRSARALRSEGVLHGDEREPNILWNEERHRIMLIDFDHATLLEPVKHKNLSKLSGKKRKWQGVIPKSQNLEFDEYV